jgi:hypothetical protein
MSRSKNWCFTLNNPTPADTDRLMLLETNPLVQYLVFGREVGESGTPHLQGFISFTERQRRNQTLTFTGQAHLSHARDAKASALYCKKDGDYTEFGTAPAGPGNRSDLEAFKEAVLSGLTNRKDIRADHSEVSAKYPRFVDAYLADQAPDRVIELHPLRDWQQTLNQDLNLAPEDRKVIFLVDLEGNKGKSWFSHYYAANHDNVQILLPGKKADMSYALDSTIRVLFIDAPRSKQGEFLQYDFLEDVKNGFVFSSKYESRNKNLGKCHVVVNMNEHPDMSKLSNDRYDVRII